jgi:hypothetical protein
MAERAGPAVGVFRVVTVLHAALTVVQAVAAGGILQASTAGLVVHQAGAGLLWLVALAQVPVAVLAWRPGRLPAWPIAVSAGLVVAETAQVAVGATGVLAVHVPLGVAIVGTAVVLAVWSLRARPRPRPPASASPPAGADRPPIIVVGERRARGEDV